MSPTELFQNVGHNRLNLKSIIAQIHQKNVTICRFRTLGGKALSVNVQLDDDLDSGDMGQLMKYQVMVSEMGLPILKLVLILFSK